jgi:hypothetical protein
MGSNINNLKRTRRLRGTGKSCGFFKHYHLAKFWGFKTSRQFSFPGPSKLRSLLVKTTPMLVALCNDM